MSAVAAVVARSLTEDVHASRGRVDVWVVALDPAARETALATLKETERAFTARLRVAAAEWAVARAALRTVLARCLGCSPTEVALEYPANGKPRLVPGTGPDVRFNLSHSGNLALIAVRVGHEVGVDVEVIRPGVDAAAIGRELLASSGWREWESLDPAAATAAFFRAWVRHEAMAKVDGRGIAGALCGSEAPRYTARELDGLPGYAAAVASEGTDWSVRRR